MILRVRIVNNIKQISLLNEHNNFFKRNISLFDEFLILLNVPVKPFHILCKKYTICVPFVNREFLFIRLNTINTVAEKTNAKAD